MSRAVPVLVLLLALLVRGEEPDPAVVPGRDVYRGEGCWQCHLQGRDGAFPAVKGSRRTGPVLDAPFLCRSREWHLAHFFAPRNTSPESAMPSYAHLFTTHPREAAVRDFIARHDSRDGSMRQDGIVTESEYEGDWRAALEAFDSGNGVISAADAAPLPGPAMEALLAYTMGLEAAAPPAAIEPREPPPLDRAESIERGAALYGRHCAGCHGERADGNGPAAAFFGDHPPRNFLRGEYKFRSTLAPDPPTDRDLFRTIRRGAGPGMPAWPHLSDRQVWDLVGFLESHHPYYVPREIIVTRGGETVDAPVVPRAGKWFYGGREVTDGMEADGLLFRLGAPVHGWAEGHEPEPVALPESDVRYTPESAAIGARIYAELSCANCHGEEGRGDGHAAARQRGSLGQVLRPTDYTRGPRNFKGGADARSLVRSFYTGLQGTPMPAYGANLTTADAAYHLAHFVMRQAGIR